MYDYDDEPEMKSGSVLMLRNVRERIRSNGLNLKRIYDELWEDYCGTKKISGTRQERRDAGINHSEQGLRNS